MSCLIEVGPSGKYCCLTTADNSQLQNMLLVSGALIIKAANLPPTPILCKVDKEFVDTGKTIGGDETCTVMCKPGVYKLDIDCADYQSVVAPEVDPVELCYTCDDEFDKLAYMFESLGDGNDATLEAMLDCLAELKLLTIANNDAAALATILAELMSMLNALTALCEKIEIGNEDQLACLETLKTLLTCIPQTPQGVVTTAWN